MNLQALLLAVVSMTTCTTAKFTVTSGMAEATTSTTEHVSFVKQWTLSAATPPDVINSIDLDLAGRVYVSYVSGLPNGVLGYVNVSGDSKAVVDAVTVGNGGAIYTGGNDGVSANDGWLNVRIGNRTSSPMVSGYLLTEISLASRDAVADVLSQRSAQVVIEDGVLVSSSTTAVLQVDVSGSSAMYVSAASTAMSVCQLQLDVEATASLQFNVESVSVAGDAQFDVQGSAAISLLASSFKAAQLQLDAQGPGTICISAKQVTATNYEGDGISQISMPNASNKYGTTGSLGCEEASVPVREPTCVSNACLASSRSGNREGVAGSGTQPTRTVTSAPSTTNGDTNESSTPRLATLVVGVISAVIAVLH